MRFYYAFTSRDNLYIVMEYLSGGDMFSLLRALGALDEAVARAYVAETVLALEYCHTQARPGPCFADWLSRHALLGQQSVAVLEAAGGQAWRCFRVTQSAPVAVALLHECSLACIDPAATTPLAGCHGLPLGKETV